jgi:hypothetical protein
MEEYLHPTDTNNTHLSETIKQKLEQTLLEAIDNLKVKLMAIKDPAQFVRAMVSIARYVVPLAKQLRVEEELNGEVLFKTEEQIISHNFKKKE